MLNNKIVLITGGTGTVGSMLVRYIIDMYTPKKLIILARNEYHQHMMKLELGCKKYIQFVLADIRDRERMDEIIEGVDYVIHTAAMKHVGFCEDHPTEAIATNIDGSNNIIRSAIRHGVEKVLFISTDKANNANCLYGSTKFIADKLCIQANENTSTKFSVLRFGNIFGSRGSVVETFMNMAKSTAVFPITDRNVSRAMITVQNVCLHTLSCLETMVGGEIFVPKMKSIHIVDLPKAYRDDAKIEFIGLKNGERLHEIIISNDEIRNTYENNHLYVIIPAFPWWEKKDLVLSSNRCSTEPITHSGEINSSHLEFMTEHELKQTLADYIENQ